MLVLDFIGVTFLFTSGVWMLLEARGTAAHTGTSLRLVYITRRY
jgi:anti-anti-sigma regulatory factor